MQVTIIDIIVLQIILWLGRTTIILGMLWGLGHVLDKTISKWLHFIGAWPAVIEALKKRAPKRAVTK
jgi:hypothetical protein